MPKFLIAETTTDAFIGSWRPCSARTLAGAQRAAIAARCFRSTEAHVGITMQDGSIRRIATLRPATSVQPGWATFGYEQGPAV